MLQTARLGFSSLAVLVSTLVMLLVSPLAAALSQEELEAYEAELLEYEKELEDRAAVIDEQLKELEKMEDDMIGGVPTERATAAAAAKVAAEGEAADAELAEAEAEAADGDEVEADGAPGKSRKLVQFGDFFVQQDRPASSGHVYTQKELRGSVIGGLSDLVPGNAAGLLLQPSDSNAAALDLTIRGVGGTTVHQATGDPGVGVFIDGVYIARSQGLTLDLLDIEQIAVQRGPQGVLSGRNTSGGAVHMRTRKPTGKFGLEQQILFGGEYDEVKAVTHLNLPRIAELVNAKVSYMLDDHKGWVVNPGEGADRNDFWSRDNQAVRLAIDIDNGGPFNFSYAFDDAEITSTAPYFQAVDAGEARRQDTARSGLAIPQSKIDIQHHNQTTVISGERAALISTIGYREVDSREYSNFDGLFGSQVTPTAGGGDQIEQDQFSIDLRLAGSLRDGAFDYIVGAQNQRENVLLTEAANNGSSDVESFAVYAQGIWALSNRLDLTLGWRETSDEKDVQSLRRNGATSGEQTRIEDDNTSYEVKLAYSKSEKFSTWLGLASAFKAAGASLLSDNGSPYDAETTETIELGFKGVARDGKIDYSLVVYNTDIDDRQVVFHDPDNLRFTDIINDREVSSIDGVELEFAIRPLKSLQISAFYSYIDTDANALAEPYVQAGTEFLFSPGAGPAVVAEIERAPSHMGSLAIDYNVASFEAGELALQVELVSTSGYFFNAFNPEQSARDILNMRVIMAGMQLEDDSGELELSLWAKNVFDDRYTTASQYVSEDSFRASKNGAVVSSFGEPSTYGVDIRYTF